MEGSAYLSHSSLVHSLTFGWLSSTTHLPSTRNLYSCFPGLQFIKIKVSLVPARKRSSSSFPSILPCSSFHSQKRIIAQWLESSTALWLHDVLNLSSRRSITDHHSLFDLEWTRSFTKTYTRSTIVEKSWELFTSGIFLFQLSQLPQM